VCHGEEGQEAITGEKEFQLVCVRHVPPRSCFAVIITPLAEASGAGGVIEAHYFVIAHVGISDILFCEPGGVDLVELLLPSVKKLTTSPPSFH